LRGAVLGYSDRGELVDGKSFRDARLGHHRQVLVCRAEILSNRSLANPQRVR
jgi:hypothetical protein